MDTNALKKFAQAARNQLIDQVSSRLEVVLADSSADRREHPQAVKDLENAIAGADRQQVIEQVAYTWFNRFTALRFMDANDYTQVRTVSPAEGATRPELLAEAVAGNLPDVAPDRILALIDGRIPSNDGQGEAYRLLLVHACNRLHDTLPYMFEQIDDYSELLMPEDLLSNASILAEMRKVMTVDACQDVEIIGWLYQFYISEKKDEVFAGLKKNQKITAENIPAATQLFTPHWIVRYLVENSLGRLWLLNRPDSKLAVQMDYYIAPEEPETDFLRITKPEEIRICDPAAGSGHMLTYTFDLLYAIYEEEGYDASTIPALILTHNLTGVEIDDRAGALAAFALAMKAAAKLGRRRFLRMEAKPDICVLQNVAFTEAEMQDVAAVVGKDLFTDELRETLGQFEQAKNFGSLIVPKLRDPAEALRVVEARNFGGDLLLKDVQARVIAVLRMAEALSPKYHVVVANPPYMSKSGMNKAILAFSEKQYPNSRSDLFAMFMDRSIDLAVKRGINALITMQSWMFLSSFLGLRTRLLRQCDLLNMVHLGENAFDSIGGSVVSTTAYVLRVGKGELREAEFLRLVDGRSEKEKFTALRNIANGTEPENVFRISTEKLDKLPGKIIGYWAGDATADAFAAYDPIEKVATPKQGLATGDNGRFTRSWSEVSLSAITFDIERFSESDDPTVKWVPYSKGGGFRRWYGYAETLVYWADGGAEIRNFKDDKGNERSRFRGFDYYFHSAGTWGKISSGSFACRFRPTGYVYDVGGMSIFPKSCNLKSLVGMLNSKVSNHFLGLLSSTLNYELGDVAKIPVEREILNAANVKTDAESCIELARFDWDAYETSWDFTTLPLLQPDNRADMLEITYTALRTHWQGMTDEMQRLEEENNRIFIDAYGLQDELTPEVPLNEITLTCNPAYRYGVKNSEDDRETRLRADTMAEFLSYAVGCMFGRYSLDAPGLILANQGETLADYLAALKTKGVPEPQFMSDEDNVIPVLDADWFPDDITERFRLFLRTTFGEAHFRENLRYIEDALSKDIRKYFTKDFYTDHVKRYKKRPIYWMFSSPKGTFNALIYMHRYQRDTVSVVLNDYLREFISKLEGERARMEKLADDPTATQGQRTKALKDATKVAQQIDELEEWERDVVFPLAQQNIEIDLDDGVKQNYPKFGKALKKIPGLS